MLSSAITRGVIRRKTEANIGAEAIYNLFKNLDLEKLKNATAAMLEKASALEREKLQKRMGLLRSMLHSNIRPEWMFITVSNR
jgi:DNA-directed RNA polymerase subunit beta'